MSLGVSVVICCHNSAKRLPQTLRHLAAQQVSAGIPWEIVVIDNASKDETAAAVLSLWPANAPAPLRLLSEPRLGKNNALRLGFLEARHEIISIIDDDNWVKEDWVERVSRLFATHPEVGICGGRSKAVTEIDPPDWFENLKPFYAIGRQHAQTGDITDALGTLLWGSGMSLRRAPLNALIADDFEFLVQDRKGSELTTGSDTELCFAMRAIGWRLWYDDALFLSHFVPKERLRWGYALRLMHGMGKASVLFELYLSALNCPPFHNRPSWKKTWLFLFLKILRNWGAVILSHPRDCLYEPEGSSAALKFEMDRGRLAMLWNMLGCYQKLMNMIAHSNWAQAGKKRPVQSS